jgi:hypothetical protein
LIARDGDGIEAIEVREIDLAAAGGRLDLERYLGLRDSGQFRQGLGDVVRQSMDLRPLIASGVGFGKQLILGGLVRQTAFHAACIAADDQILRFIDGNVLDPHKQ